MDDQPPELDEAVEVSDLREKPSTASPIVRDIRRPLLTPRQRMRRLAVSGGSMLLALLILLAVAPSLRKGADSWLAGFVPTPTATLPPGAGRFYFIASVPNIQLFIDGRSISHLPRIGADPPLALARGQHRISWNAAPFLPQRCLLSVPFNPNDTCGVAIPVSTPLRQVSVAVSIFLLRESLTTLSADQQSAVVATIQHGLPDYASAIQPGDHYAFTQVGTQPLRGTLDFQLDTSNFGAGDACGLSPQPPYIVCNFTANPCAVCTMPPPILASAGMAVAPSSWYVITFVRLSYTISALNGQPLITNGPISAGGLAVQDYPILIALTWDGAVWHAQPLLGPGYDALLQRLNASAAFSPQPLFTSPYLADLGCAAMPDFIGPNVAINHYGSVSFVAGPNPADGCLAIVTVDTASGAQRAYYLYRFGGLVAVNDVAQRQQSLWPAASAHERQIAAAILSSGAPAP
ncbi:MAG TPA: hypothetical protein VF725_04150 [Ktedonobacterales bacterium]|jgi:hypothetical protein